MKKSHRHYEFGTFEERLAHVCALLEIEDPGLNFDKDSTVSINEDIIAWTHVNGINLEWLLIGNPSFIVMSDVEKRLQVFDIIEVTSKIEPELRVGLRAFLRAVVFHSVPIDEAYDVFSEVVKEFR